MLKDERPIHLRYCSGDGLNADLIADAVDDFFEIRTLSIRLRAACPRLLRVEQAEIFQEFHPLNCFCHSAY